MSEHARAESAGFPLAGKTIVVTRPRAQADTLARMIAAEGGNAFLFPLLEINPPDAAGLAVLDAFLERINTYAMAAFVSPNAVLYSIPRLLAQRGWPANLIPLAVGQSTVKTLADHGIAGAVAPGARFDSEALLELPELSEERVRGRKILILRGDGGRELLAETLRQRGAQVDCVSCYLRTAPSADASPLLARARAHALDALTVSSSEALQYFAARLGEEEKEIFASLPMFVPHARIAAVAAELGFCRVIRTPPADAGILAGLCAYNWP
ncbi:MAG: uroporphyrinogen-III synthase [Betaproteobacteria bacterium]|nr:uroporphyrinogen-III synthase [Betaproteobacteria bacterium]